MLILFKYLKLAVWSGIYYLQENKSETIFNIIVKNIHNCGCVTIKFTQWLLPKIEVLYDIDVDKKENKWFLELEKMYDNCNIHSIEYTKKLYKEEFRNEIDCDYTVDGVIASGSIGQVYKVKNNIDKKYYAMKVLHPNVDKELSYVYCILLLLYNLPIINNIIKYYIPIDIKTFIEDFKVQTNLINEGNNCIHFRHHLNGDKCYIVPTVYKMSKKILIMSYEEGKSFDKLDVSDYTRSKIIAIIKLFIKSNQYSHRLHHGDMHKGNWKVRFTKDNIPQIVIYDYGFCWKMPKHLESTEVQLSIDRAFILPIDNIEKYSKACQILLNERTSLENIEIIVKDLINIDKISYQDPIFLIKLIIRCCRNDNYLIDSFIFQSIIIHTQLTKNIEKYITTKRGDDGRSYYYGKEILDLINICDTYDICNTYKDILKIESDKYSEKSLFNNSSIKLNNMEYLKKRAINPQPEKKACSTPGCDAPGHMVHANGRCNKDAQLSEEYKSYFS